MNFILTHHIICGSKSLDIQIGSFARMEWQWFLVKVLHLFNWTEMKRRCHNQVFGRISPLGRWLGRGISKGIHRIVWSGRTYSPLPTPSLHPFHGPFPCFGSGGSLGESLYRELLPKWRNMTFQVFGAWWQIKSEKWEGSKGKPCLEFQSRYFGILDLYSVFFSVYPGMTTICDPCSETYQFLTNFWFPLNK